MIFLCVFVGYHTILDAYRKGTLHVSYITISEGTSLAIIVCGVFVCKCYRNHVLPGKVQTIKRKLCEKYLLLPVTDMYEITYT